MDTKSNIDNKETLKSEIRELYKKLLIESQEKKKSGSNLTLRIEPSAHSYFVNAKRLIDLSLELSSLVETIMPSSLQSILNREVAQIKNFEYEYGKNGRPTEKSKSSLINLMEDVNCKLERQLYELLIEST